MLTALLYLRLTSFKNWLTSRGRRLRQPKYFASALVGCAYFYFFFFRNLAQDPDVREARASSAQAQEVIEVAQAALPVDWLPAMTAMGALALLTFIALMWIVPTQRAALGFSEAEIAFLFPAPMTRRALVHFRLLSAQFRSLIGATFMMLLSNRWALVGGNPLTHAVGWWFIFSALNLHHSGANFTLTRLNDLGVAAWRRRVWVTTALGAMIGITFARLPSHQRLPGLENDVDLTPLTDWLVNVSNTTPLSVLLWPIKIVIAPFLAIAPRDFFLAAGPALVVLLLHYAWVVRSAVAFEDATIDQVQKRTARIAAWRSGERRGGAPTKGRRGPFRLASTGRVELAFLWKNLLSTWPYFTVRVFVGCAVLIVATCGWLATQPTWGRLLPAVASIALMLAAYTVIIGPQFARQDIRGDLSQIDILKTYPIPGWQIVLGELLAPMVILTGVLWLALLAIAFSFQGFAHGWVWLTPGLRVAAIVALALIAPVLVTLQLLVPNAAALLFPGWFQLSRTRGGGPEVIGQRMIFFFAQLLTMLVALLPAVGFGALLIFILQWLIGPLAAVVMAGLVVWGVLAAEVGCGLWWLGRRFDRLDLSAEVRA